MSDPQTGDPELPSKPVTAPVGTPLSALDLDNLMPGALWRGKYQVQDVLPDITHGKLMRATAVDTGREVIIRSFRVTDDGRARTCERLKRVSSGVIAPVETLEVEGRRVEITEALQAPTLATWSAGKKLGPEALKILVAQLVPLVATLHENGVAHLNLKPEAILVAGGPAAPKLLLGALEAATDFTKSGLVSITVEPFYAPPEAVGLYQHHCGPALRAWDWWSVGRILQELVLGQHVLGVFLNRDVTRHTPELLIRADQFLRENQGATCRAGGVEIMPDLDPGVATLLRGLLSGCRDARWGRPDLEAWLKGEPVKERYHLGQNERLFVWKDRGYAISEAAEFFSEPQNWPDAPLNVFDRDNPATLAHFLSENSEYRRLDQRLADLVRMSGSSAFADLDPNATREVFTGIALGTLGNGALTMRLRGRQVDLAYLRELLQPEAQPAGLGLVEVLSETAAIQHISPFDGDAGRLLMDVGHVSGAAIALAASNHWLTRADRARLARFRLIALESPAELDARVEKGRSLYAISRDDRLNEVLTKGELTPAERVVLAFVFEDAAHFRLVTHTDWCAEQYRALHDKGEKLARVSTWLHLGAALRSAPHLLGPWPAFGAYWIVIGACVAVAFPSRLTLGVGFGLVVLALMGRIVGGAAIRSAIKARVPDSASRSVPSPKWCDEEAARLYQTSLLPARKALEKEIASVNGSIRALKSSPASAEVSPTCRFLGIRILGMGTATASIALLGGLGWRIYQHPPQLAALKTAWLNPPQVEAKPEPAPRTPEIPKKEDKPVETKMSWGFRPSDSPVSVHLSETREATGAETKAAAEIGERVTDPYKRETIDQLVAVRVPSKDGIKLMLYDGRSERVADRRVFVATYVPLQRSWVVLGDRVAIFLAEP